MIGLEDRQALALAIHTAQRSGARRRLASEAACIDLRTLQRWKAGDGLASDDGRPLVMLCTSRPRTQLSVMVRQHPRLASHRRRQAQPRARLDRHSAFEGQRYAALGCMRKGATPLTRTATGPHAEHKRRRPAPR